jgi:hypothetical protein
MNTTKITSGNMIKITRGNVIHEFTNVPESVAKAIYMILCECQDGGHVVGATMYIDEDDEDDKW